MLKCSVAVPEANPPGLGWNLQTDFWGTGYPDSLAPLWRVHRDWTLAGIAKRENGPYLIKAQR